MKNIGMKTITANITKGKKLEVFFDKCCDLSYRNECLYGCPVNTKCEWGFCECVKDYMKLRGRCFARVTADMLQNIPQADYTGSRCQDQQDCTKHDINLICGMDNKCRLFHQY